MTKDFSVISHLEAGVDGAGVHRVGRSDEVEGGWQDQMILKLPPGVRHESFNGYAPETD